MKTLERLTFSLKETVESRDFSSYSAYPTMFFICLLSAIFLYFFAFPIHHDLAGGVLTGALSRELGAAFWNYNSYFPPIEQIWFEAAVALSDATGLGADTTILAQTYVVALISAGLGYHIRRNTAEATPLFFVISFVILITFPVIYFNLFGLREHLVVMGLWPYLVLRAADPNRGRPSHRDRIALGIWLGTFLLFKFLYCTIVVLVEIVDACLQRDARLLFRLENIVSASIVVLYLAVWLGLDPIQRQNIALIKQSLSAFLNTDRATVVTLIRLCIVFILLSTWALFGPDRRRLFIGLAAVVGALAVFWLQQRGFHHHIFPVTMAIIVWWWLASAGMPKWAHALPLVVLFVDVNANQGGKNYHRAQVALSNAVLEDTGIALEGKRVALINQLVNPFNEILVAHGGLRWTPTPNIAYVSAELRELDRPENRGMTAPPMEYAAPGFKKFHNQLMRFWRDYPPDIIIFEKGTHWPLLYLDLDWQEFYGNDPDFQNLMAQFVRKADFRSDLVSFEVYVRAP